MTGAGLARGAMSLSTGNGHDFIVEAAAISG
jgi:hypothetical protein